MCGIVGAWLKKDNQNFPAHILTSALRHRGPDDEGYVLIDPESGQVEERSGPDTHPEVNQKPITSPQLPSQTLIFGHRRLAILDTSAAGHQPMSLTDGDLWITYNGEIFNYIELRDELSAEGAVFRTGTDTEVILHAYRKWGEECLHHFNGMWAFGIWDNREKKLFCARDRYGIKPFYYTILDDGFYFASEIKALLKVPGLEIQYREEAIYDYMILGRCHLEPDTFFRRIRSLASGHQLVRQLDGKLDIRQWYNLPEDGPRIKYNGASISEFRERFADSVKLRLRSDVEVGSCLSGGLDSSSIVALACEQHSGPFNTFSAGFDDPALDERAYIEAVVKKTGAREHIVLPDAAGLWSELQHVVFQQEEPFGSSSIYAQWCVMRRAQTVGVPVLLDGQGGDELLGGYLRYRINRASSYLGQWSLNGWMIALENPMAFGYRAFGLLPAGLRQKIADYWGPSGEYFRTSFYLRHQERKRHYFTKRTASQATLHRTLKSDFYQYSLPVLLRYEDKNSMRFSIETRLPMLDYRFVEWIFQLEESAKINENSTKDILRHAMRQALPSEVNQRADKIGFTTPQGAWLNAYRKDLHALFSDEDALLSKKWIQPKMLLRDIEAGRLSRPVLWRALNLELWLRTFFGEKDKTNENTSTEPVLST